MSDFVSWLTSLDEERLADLLRRRPEALRGSAAVDLAAVESRLAQPHDIAAALLEQPRPALQVLTAVLLQGGHVSVGQCAAALEGRAGDEHRQRIRSWLGRLEQWGLAWVDDDEVVQAAPRVGAVLAVPADWGTPARTLIEAFSKDALAPMLRAWGLPRQSTKAATVAVLAESFQDPERLGRQLDLLAPEHRKMLGEPLDVTAGYADQRWFAQHANAYRAASDAGLIFGLYAYSPLDAEVPAEVRMAVRGTLLPFDPIAPPLPTGEVSADMVQRESRAALELFNESSLTVLDGVRAHPVKRLQNGGIGAREIARVAKAAKVDAIVVRLVLELACGAELLEPDGSVLRWGDVAGAWRDLDAGPRVALVLEHWLTALWSPTQTHDAGGTSLAVGDRSRSCPLCRDGRRATLEEWARRDGGVTDDSLAALLAWKRPLTHATHREIVEEADEWDYRFRGRYRPSAPPEPPMVMSDDRPDLGTIADEARLLGLVAHGVGTPLLAALLGGDRPALVAMADAMLPAAASRATFGSDLTAVVVGPPGGELSALLDSCADRESRGGAVTWRFSTASVRRALDAGTTAARLTERLTDVATAGLPQPLTYLLADVGRRHGVLRVAPATSVIRCEDPALLAEVSVDRKLRKLGLRLVAPTVAASAAGEAETLAAMRAAGYLPMPETPEPAAEPSTPTTADLADRATVIDLAARRRSSLVRDGARATASAPAPEDPASAAARLVGIAHARGTSIADPRLVAAIRHANRSLSDPEVMTLAEAVLAGKAVRIRYRSASSSVTDRVVSDLELSGHLLEGWCHLRNDERVFRLSEILSVAYP